jgi:hypothetical protein
MQHEGHQDDDRSGDRRHIQNGIHGGENGKWRHG